MTPDFSRLFCLWSIPVCVLVLTLVTQVTVVQVKYVTHTFLMQCLTLSVCCPNHDLLREVRLQYVDYGVCDFLSSAGQLVSTIPVLFLYTLTFKIIRVPRNSPLLLTLICRQRLRTTQLWVCFLIIRFRVLWRCLL